MTHQLLAFGRKQLMQPKLLDMNRVLAEIKPMVDSVVKENVKFHVQTDPALGTIKADRGQIEQAILNLTLNARDAMPGGGQITAKVENAELDEAFSKEHPSVPPGRYVRLTIADTGTGMSPEVIERAFEPFFTTKEIGKGTGLGLSMVFGVMRQSGGTVRIQSRLREGTTIQLFLPRAMEAETSGAGRVTPAQSAGGAQILVVDDDPDVRWITAEDLRTIGHFVAEADSGRAALTHLER